MLTWQDTIGLELPSAGTFSSFHAYVDAAEELFVESMEDAAENEWHLIADRLEGATEREIGAEMERWWNDQVRRFRIRLWMKHHRQQFKRITRNSRLRLIHAHEQLRAAQVEIECLRCDLAGAEALADYLKEQRRGRHCDGGLGN